MRQYVVAFLVSLSCVLTVGAPPARADETAPDTLAANTATRRVAVRSEPQLSSQEDPTQGATIEVQQEVEKQEPTGFSVHGVGYLQYFAPFSQPSSVNLFLGQLETQWTDGTFGVYTTLRLRITDFSQPVNKGYFFAQQAYGFYRTPYAEVKVGKIYQRFGRLWDYGFYGPLLANNDIKLQPDLGVSIEGAPNIIDHFDLEYALQYFAVDGRTFSVSNPELFSLDGARRRNIVVARVAPTFRLNSDAWFSLGVSGERYDSTFLDHQVLRGAIDVDANYGPLSAFVEVGRQEGSDVVQLHNILVPSQNYIWAGARLTFDPVNIRYNVNAIYYDNAMHSVDLLHQPGIEVAVNDHLSFMGEMVIWTSTNPINLNPEKSFYLIAVGKF